MYIHVCMYLRMSIHIYQRILTTVFIHVCTWAETPVRGATTLSCYDACIYVDIHICINIYKYVYIYTCK